MMRSMSSLLFLNCYRNLINIANFLVCLSFSYSFLDTHLLFTNALNSTRKKLDILHTIKYSSLLGKDNSDISLYDRF